MNTELRGEKRKKERSGFKNKDVLVLLGYFHIVGWTLQNEKANRLNPFRKK